MAGSSLTAGGTSGSNVSLTIGPPSRRASTALIDTRGVGRGSEAFHAASFGTQELSAWHPRLASADAEYLGTGARDRIVARARDLERNNGWADGGIEKRVDSVVGARIWLKAKPDYVALGQTPEWADEWAIKTESLFRLWANSPRFLCDVERHHQFGGLVRMAYRHYILDGEAFAALYFIEDRGGMFGTAVNVIDPDRLANPDGKPDSDRLRGGIELDRYGAAQAYWVRKAHENDLTTTWDASKFERIPRETATGRPIAVHVFNKKRAHMRRGISRLSSVMARMKMLDRYDATELQAAITNAIFGLYAKTQRDSAGMAESMAPVSDDYDTSAVIDDARANFYEESDLTLDGVRIAVVPKGDEIDTIEATRAGSNFAAFQRAVLNSIASALGISGEQLSNNWADINYSSARTLLNEIWRSLYADRHIFTHAFCTPIYLAWLEEAIARDLVEVPGGKAMFYLFRDALAQCEWVGPGRGWIDPKKEAEAAEIRMRLGMTALPAEAAEQGEDWRSNLWDAKRVQVQREEYGLATAAAADGAGTDDDDDPDRRDREEREQSRGSRQGARE